MTTSSVPANDSCLACSLPSCVSSIRGRDRASRDGARSGIVPGYPGPWSETSTLTRTDIASDSAGSGNRPAAAGSGTAWTASRRRRRRRSSRSACRTTRRVGREVPGALRRPRARRGSATRPRGPPPWRARPRACPAARDARHPRGPPGRPRRDRRARRRSLSTRVPVASGPALRRSASARLVPGVATSARSRSDAGGDVTQRRRVGFERAGGRPDDPPGSPLPSAPRRRAAAASGRPGVEQRDTGTCEVRPLERRGDRDDVADRRQRAMSNGSCRCSR
jgi:hypothetical protein